MSLYFYVKTLQDVFDILKPRFCIVEDYLPLFIFMQLAGDIHKKYYWTKMLFIGKIIRYFTACITKFTEIFL